MTDFNPERISLAGKGETEVITFDELQAFEEEMGISGSGRFTSSLLGGVERASRVPLGSRNRTGFNGDQPEPYDYKDGEVFGIKAEEARRLLEDLERGKISIYGIGDRSIELFGLFCDELELEEII